MKPIITYETHLSGVSRTIVAVYHHYSEYVLFGERPQPNPTDMELNSIPAVFRCYVCLRQRGKRKLGGIIREKRVCRCCFPYVDNRTIRGLIACDRRHHPRKKYNPMKARRKIIPKLPPDLLSLIQSIAAKEKRWK